MYIFAAIFCINIRYMKVKKDRLDTLRMIISSREMGSQDELLTALQQEGFKLTQATLSRDLKQLKVLLCMNCGSCTYVCPANRKPAETNQLAKALIPRK